MTRLEYFTNLIELVNTGRPEQSLFMNPLEEVLTDHAIITRFCMERLKMDPSIIVKPSKVAEHYCQLKVRTPIRVHAFASRSGAHLYAPHTYGVKIVIEQEDVIKDIERLFGIKVQQRGTGRGNNYKAVLYQVTNKALNSRNLTD